MLVMGYVCKSQTQPTNTVNVLQKYTVDSMLLDFTVPDLPAFKALGTDPSNILRPSDASKFAVMLNPFFSNGTAVIPKGFALEFSPWKIASRHWTVQEYRESPLKRILYNSSFSLGTSPEDKETPETQIAIGYRVKILGKEADLLTSSRLPAIYQLQAQELQAKQGSQDHWRRERNISIISFTNSQELQEEFNSFYADSVAHRPVLAAIDSFRNENWNARRLDLAFAVVGASSDSLAKNTKYKSFQLWATFAQPLYQNVQLLIGGSFLTAEDGTNDFTINTRLYVGNKNVRGYAEYQYKSDDIYTSGDVANETVKTGLINLGGEFRLDKRFWVDFYGGIENLYGDGDASRFRTSLSLKYGLNDK